MKDKYIVFDLDDTLTYEIDYLESAFEEIARTIDSDNWKVLHTDMMTWHRDGLDAFGLLIEQHPTLLKSRLLEMYRNHYPSIKLIDGAQDVFNYCKDNSYRIGLITDGRSITQRNKLKALGLDDVFSQIIVSEEFGSTKPCEANYKVFVNEENCKYYYIGDNIKKDFITPNKLGWTSICLKDRGYNIHNQNEKVSKAYQPDYYIENLKEIIDILQTKH